jgi:hypothetical protein
MARLKDLYFDVTSSIDDGTSDDVIIRRLIEYYVMEYRVAKDIFDSIKARHMVEVAAND